MAISVLNILGSKHGVTDERVLLFQNPNETSVPRNSQRWFDFCFALNGIRQLFTVLTK